MSYSTRLCSSISMMPTPKSPHWVADYNLQRPHSSLKYLTPVAYAAHLTATDDRLRNPDQLRRSSVAPPAPLGVQTPETLTAAG
ncbi:transposase InsO family protein [Bradyrhizobium sp. USDA 4459]